MADFLSRNLLLLGWWEVLLRLLRTRFLMVRYPRSLRIVHSPQVGRLPRIEDGFLIVGALAEGVGWYVFLVDARDPEG